MLYQGCTQLLSTPQGFCPFSSLLYVLNLHYQLHEACMSLVQKLRKRPETKSIPDFFSCFPAYSPKFLTAVWHQLVTQPATRRAYSRTGFNCVKKFRAIFFFRDGNWQDGEARLTLFFFGHGFVSIRCFFGRSYF